MNPIILISSFILVVIFLIIIYSAFKQQSIMDSIDELLGWIK